MAKIITKEQISKYPNAEVYHSSNEVKDVDLESVHKELLNTLRSETHRLFLISRDRLLGKEESIAFERCVKIMREFSKEEREILELSKGLDETDV